MEDGEINVEEENVDRSFNSGDHQYSSTKDRDSRHPNRFSNDSSYYSDIRTNEFKNNHYYSSNYRKNVQYRYGSEYRSKEDCYYDKEYYGDRYSKHRYKPYGDDGYNKAYPSSSLEYDEYNRSRPNYKRLSSDYLEKRGDKQEPDNTENIARCQNADPSNNETESQILPKEDKLGKGSVNNSPNKLLLPSSNSDKTGAPRDSNTGSNYGDSRNPRSISLDLDSNMTPTDTKIQTQSSLSNLNSSSKQTSPQGYNNRFDSINNSTTPTDYKPKRFSSRERLTEDFSENRIVDLVFDKKEGYDTFRKTSSESFDNKSASKDDYYYKRSSSRYGDSEYDYRYNSRRDRKDYDNDYYYSRGSNRNFRESSGYYRYPRDRRDSGYIRRDNYYETDYYKKRYDYEYHQSRYPKRRDDSEYEGMPKSPSKYADFDDSGGYREKDVRNATSPTKEQKSVHKDAPVLKVDKNSELTALNEKLESGSRQSSNTLGKRRVRSPSPVDFMGKPFSDNYMSDGSDFSGFKNVATSTKIEHSVKPNSGGDVFKETSVKMEYQTIFTTLEPSTRNPISSEVGLTSNNRNNFTNTNSAPSPRSNQNQTEHLHPIPSNANDSRADVVNQNISQQSIQPLYQSTDANMMNVEECDDFSSTAESLEPSTKPVVGDYNDWERKNILPEIDNGNVNSKKQVAYKSISLQNKPVQSENPDTFRQNFAVDQQTSIIQESRNPLNNNFSNNNMKPSEGASEFPKNYQASNQSSENMSVESEEFEVYDKPQTSGENITESIPGNDSCNIQYLESLERNKSSGDSKTSQPVTNILVERYTSQTIGNVPPLTEPRRKRDLEMEQFETARYQRNAVYEANETVSSNSISSDRRYIKSAATEISENQQKDLLEQSRRAEVPNDKGLIYKADEYKRLGASRNELSQSAASDLSSSYYGSGAGGPGFNGGSGYGKNVSKGYAFNHNNLDSKNYESYKNGENRVHTSDSSNLNSKNQAKDSSVLYSSNKGEGNYGGSSFYGEPDKVQSIQGKNFIHTSSLNPEQVPYDQFSMMKNRSRTFDLSQNNSSTVEEYDAYNTRHRNIPTSEYGESGNLNPGSFRAESSRFKETFSYSSSRADYKDTEFAPKGGFNSGYSSRRTSFSSTNIAGNDSIAPKIMKSVSSRGNQQPENRKSFSGDYRGKFVENEPDFHKNKNIDENQGEALEMQSQHHRQYSRDSRYYNEFSHKNLNSGGSKDETQQHTLAQESEYREEQYNSDIRISRQQSYSIDYVHRVFESYKKNTDAFEKKMQKLILNEISEENKKRTSAFELALANWNVQRVEDQETLARMQLEKAEFFNL
ncbi:hypothetical protein BB560_001466 [Smittium megazygosporum]|uniref:Uncharacterized protein n=1 Tax=Smittium megazygosporum TaxID=133381 RepID=A0A2T9ZHI3_9FUNG|nr:hypothetical protein BB560_001466 [Smittium megazygosporum]